MFHNKFLLALALLSLAVFKPTPISAEDNPSFTNDIKPILDSKCVSCHACYDSPAQLDLTSVKGIQRGAKKFDPYMPRMASAEPTILWESPKSVDQWQQSGFFSVIEGGKNSVLAKMLELGRQNPVEPNNKFPTSIEIDSLARKNTMPDALEIDGYIKAHPLEGMPLAVSGLTEEEYAKVMNWLEQGAQFDHVAPEPTAVEKAKIKEWEEFLNRADNRAKLIARYIYEHTNLFNTYFDTSKDHNFFQLIRSSTPMGQDPIPVDTRRPNSPVDGTFYYRYQIIDKTRCSKLHQLLLDASGDKLDRYKKIFAETDWDVKDLPGYSTAERMDPLGTFAAIPAKARWKYLLEDVRLHRGTIIWGPSCRGNLTVGSVQEQEWDFFENPETSLYVNDAEYRAKVASDIAQQADTDDLYSFITWVKEYGTKRKKILAEATARRGQADGYLARLEDIWRGDKPGDTPLVAIYRNDDNAYVAEAGRAVGDWPKTTWVLDLPILELMMYNSVVNFDLFGDMVNWLNPREAFGMLRRTAESNFLRFLPADQRQAIYESWYATDMSALRREKESDFGPDTTVPTAIQFKTNDPKREFQQMLLDHIQFTETADPINRPQPGDQSDRITAALRSIVEASKEDGPAFRKFKTMLPQAAFLRIDAAGKEPMVYTMTLDRDYASKAFALSILQEADPAKAQVTIYPGILTAYPNFIFRIDEGAIEDFSAALIDADTPDKFTAVIERWGVRRSSPDFWQTVHSIQDYVQRTDPKKAAVFDVNRYKNL